MRALLIGASGQLGRALSSAFSSRHEVIGAAHRHAEPRQLTIDLADSSGTLSALRDVRPELILIAGAMCNVDLCELEPEACHRVNVLGPRAVAEYARENGCRVILFSTDHVFNGGLEACRESDPVAPLNAYARSKVLSEAILRELLPDRHLVIRTSWLYGPDAHRRNFVLRFIDRVAAGESVPVPVDQWGSPTYTKDVADATLFLSERGYTGTFHAAGSEFVNRVSLARRICAHFGLDEGRIAPKPTSELKQAARRPLRVRLDCRKLQAVWEQEFKTIDAGLVSLRAWDAPLRHA